jgi:hypothetical protein
MVSKRWIAVVAGAVLVTSMLPGVAVAAPVPPQADPFYTPPAGYESTAPGTVLRSRVVAAAAFATLPQNVQAWQVLYRTTDSLGDPEATVTTILEPTDPQPHPPLLAYQVAEDSPALQCAMSYEYQLRGGYENYVAQAEILLIDAAVEKGWAVTLPDYEGPRSAYVAGRQAGQAVLDAIRATENFPTAGLEGRSTEVGLWGYSGGALASGWASELQPAYAPELDIRGIAEGGLPVNPAHVLARINGGEFSGVAMSGIAGMSQAYPRLADFLHTYLNAAGEAAFAKAASQCNPQNSNDFAYTNVSDYFTIPDPFDAPVPHTILAQDNLGQHAPAAPLFVYQSQHDEVIPPADVDAVVRTYCSQGTDVTFERDTLSDHIALVLTGAPDALNWLADRLSGTPAVPGCHISDVASSLLSPSALLAFTGVLYADVLALAGQPIGTDDMA